MTDPATGPGELTSEARAVLKTAMPELTDETTGWKVDSSSLKAIDAKIGTLNQTPKSVRPPTNIAEFNDWTMEMFLWGRRVRRDILVLEQYLREVGKIKDKAPDPSFIGDPGDPPPPYIG
jgi:hypothetical protein